MAIVEPSGFIAVADYLVQLEQHGYLVTDRVDHVPDRKTVLN